jgi:hypothetical protein
MSSDARFDTDVLDYATASISNVKVMWARESHPFADKQA